MTIFSDKTLSQKLERTEARTSVNFVEARKILFPEVGVEWIEIAGVYAMFDGAESPLTQTFGLGLFDEITGKEFDEIESFFQKHNAPILHEVSPMADASLLGLLNERGYQPIELTNIMFRSLELEDEINLPKNPNIGTRITGADEINIFAKTAVAGRTAETPEFESFALELCKVAANSKCASSFIAEIEGVPIATCNFAYLRKCRRISRCKHDSRISQTRRAKCPSRGASELCP